MDFDLIDNLSEDQVSDLYEDVVDGDEKDFFADIHWGCRVYIQTPSNSISYFNIDEKYSFRLEHYRKYNYANPLTVWYRQSTSPYNNTVAFYSRVSEEGCGASIYTCFDIVYYKNFHITEGCGKGWNSPIQNPAYEPKNPSYNSNYTGAYHMQHFYAHSVSQHNDVLYKASIGESKMTIHREYFYFFYYVCSLKQFIPFYRDEYNNETIFNSYMKVVEYSIKNSFSPQYFGNASFYNFWTHYEFLRNENTGEMYIHMYCYR